MANNFQTVYQKIQELETLIAKLPVKTQWGKKAVDAALDNLGPQVREWIFTAEKAERGECLG